MIDIHEGDAHRSAIRSAASEFQRFQEHNLSEEEVATIAYSFWNMEMLECLESDDKEGAWHRVLAAALGEKVFEGPRRICRAHLEGLPVGLVCSHEGLMLLVHDLYYNLRLHTNQQHLDAHPLREFASWKVTTEDGTALELLRPGEGIARILARQNGLRYKIAALLARAIGEYISSYRRLEPQLA